MWKPLRTQVGLILLIIILFLPNDSNSWNYKWTGKGRLFDERNQYHVTCRLTKEKRVTPWIGEDTVKCFYTCSDKEKMVITTHSDFACQKEIKSARGDKRDWRSK